VRSRYALAAAAALAVAVALRTVPLYASPLPFNPDGIVHARWAATTVREGALPLADLATDDLHFPPLLAVVALVADVPPMRIAQPVSALVGAVAGLVGLALARRLAARRGWSRRETFAAATLAGGLLAVEGLYLHRSAPTDEQTVGLLLVPLAAVALGRAATTGRRAWWAVVAAAGGTLAPVHNLDGTVFALGLAVVAALAVARESGRRAMAMVGVALAGGAVLAAWHAGLPRLTAVYVHQQDRLLDVPGLVLAWLVLVAVGGTWYVGRTARTQRAVGVGAAAVGFGLLALNAATTVFPGTPSTPPALLAALLPLALPVALAATRLPDATRPTAEGIALGAMMAGPLVLVGVSLTAGLSPVYLATAYRATTFLHLPVLVLAALGTVAVGRWLATGRNVRAGTALRVGLAVAIVCAAAVSSPIAFGGLSVLNYKGVTTTGELSASTFAADHAGEWAGDDHLVRVAPPPGNGTTGPAYDWLRGGGPPPDCFVLGQRSWTTTGAQFYPAAPERLDAAAFGGWTTSRDVVYRGGAGDPVVGVAPTGDGAC